VVGDTLNHITDAIRRRGMEWVHMRHEEAGAFAAGADAYMTGQLAQLASKNPNPPSWVNSALCFRIGDILIRAAKFLRCTNKGKCKFLSDNSVRSRAGC
jgi:hypothetical protein